jgi:hypothetical protein
MTAARRLSSRPATASAAGTQAGVLMRAPLTGRGRAMLMWYGNVRGPARSAGPLPGRCRASAGPSGRRGAWPRSRSARRAVSPVSPANVHAHGSHVAQSDALGRWLGIAGVVASPRESRPAINTGVERKLWPPDLLD